MKKNALQQTWVRIVLTVLTAAVMAMIFWFSAETAEDSDETSGQISRQVIHILYPDYETYDDDWKSTLFNNVQYIVRKAAHFTEYTLLGILIRLCLESWFGKRKWLNPVSWAAGAFYACTDEMHQLLTEGRNSQWTDVLIDSCGVLAGAAVAAGALYWIRKKAAKGKGRSACP